MERDEVVRHVVETIRGFMPEGTDADITEQTCPITELGIDSHDGVECACILSDRLGFQIPIEMNPIVEDGPVRRPMRIGEIADVLCELVSETEGESDVGP